MQSIPPEFQQFQIYLSVGQQFQSRYPDIGDVMNLSFSRNCQEYAETNQISPEAEQFLKDFNVNHAAPSENAAQITRQVANSFFNTLLKMYNAKKFSAAMSKQLTLIGFLFDALDGASAYDAFQKCVEMRNNVQAVLSGSIQPDAVPTMDPPIQDPEPQPTPNQFEGPPAFPPPSSNPPSTFTSPSPNSPPAYTPPSSNQFDGPPAYPPPSNSYNQPPAFTPPSGNSPPTFTPPSVNQLEGPPAFTPPNAPTFYQPNNDYPAVPDFSTSTVHAMPTIPDQPPAYSPPSSYSPNQPPAFTPGHDSMNVQQLAYTPPDFKLSSSDDESNDNNQTIFDPNAARSLLTTLGYPLADISTFPPLNDQTTRSIQNSLSSAIECLKNNDNARSLSFLQNAYRTWATGFSE